MDYRLPPILPDQLNPEQREMYETFNEQLVRPGFGETFTTRNSQGAYVGPFAPFLHHPKELVDGFLNLSLGIASLPGLPASCREIAIVVTGVHFGAAYEVYAHERVAAKVGLSREQVLEIKSGKKPSGCNEQESIAWEVATALVQKKGPLDKSLWEKAVGALGKTGAMSLVNYVAQYSYVSVFLNGFDVPVPEGEKLWES